MQELNQVSNSNRKRIDGLLYGILDTGYVELDRMQHVAEALIEGGVGVLQLRAKGYDSDGVIKLVREYAPRLAEMCKSQGIPFVINDFSAAAVELQADGLHIGQDDGSLADVRKVVGRAHAGRSIDALT